MKKALFISYDGMTDPLGQSQVLPYLAKLSRDYEIHILSFEKKDRYQAERLIIENIANAYGIRWHPQFFHAKPPVLSKMYDRWKLLRQAEKLHRKYNYDLVHCRSYISAEAGLRLKKKHGVKFLFDMRGFWADEKVDNGQWNQDKFLYRKIYSHYKNREKDFLLNADGIISLTHAGKEHLLRQPQYAKLDIRVIPCCVDLEHFDYNRVDPARKDQLLNSLGIEKGNRVITYLGSVGGWYMSEEMFDFFKKLIERQPAFTMLFLTKDDPGKVKELAGKCGMPQDKLIIRYARRDEVPLYLSITDWSIFFIRPSFSKTASSPTKHGELMGMGIPVICNDIGDTGNIIRKTGTGIVVGSFDEAGYQPAIEAMPALQEKQRSGIREAAFAYFDLEKGALCYKEVYDSLTTPGPVPLEKSRTTSYETQG